MARMFWRTIPVIALLLLALPMRADEPKAEDKKGADDADTPAITLKIGSPAPKLAVSKWLNGDGVQKIEKGKVYVVEFWATWCGPCVAAMPHLSKLNTQYKDKGVVFIGMNLGEDLEQVEPFLKQNDDKMNYRVAIDEPSEKSDADTNRRPNGKTAAAWFSAAGQQGIPCTFVVNKDSVVAWIGHPMQIDKVLEEIVAGTYDVAKAAALAEKVAARERRLSNILIKLKRDYEAGSALAASAGEKEFKDDAQALNMLAWEMLDSVPETQRDLNTALKLATRAADLTKHDDGAILDTLARAYFEKGDVAKAVELQTKAVDKSEAGLKEELQATLDRYKKAGDKPVPEKKNTKKTAPKAAAK